MASDQERRQELQNSWETSWRDPLRELAARIRVAVRESQAESSQADLARPLHQGAGDLTYGIDEGTEVAAARWMDEVVAREPLSLFTEDRGWRHAVRDTEFNHDGPRIVLDPIDGTRNLMLDLRSAWTEIAWCGAGAEEPHAGDVSASLLAELPDQRGGRYRVLEAGPDGIATMELREVGSDALIDRRELCVDDDDVLEHRILSFFRYEPRHRARITAVETTFFGLLEKHEGVNTRHCFDDQYISNAGQLALLALGKYRFVCDLRAYLAERHGEDAVSSKPYDVAGALHLARAAGCVVETPEGKNFNFPLDATTPVSFVGYANEATAARLRPHLMQALRQL